MTFLSSSKLPILFFMLSLIHCVAKNNRAVEVVMRRGMVIEVTNKNGSLRVEAKKGSKRSYSWEGQSKAVKLAEERIRYFGSLGLASKESIFPFFTKDIHGINRVIAKEGQQHFSSKEEALGWLNQEGWKKDTLDLVYNSTGLVVGFVKTLHRKQIDIEVWQIYINGKKPNGLKGARNKQIKTWVVNGGCLIPLRVSDFQPSKAQVIGGLSYFGRALDRMKEFQGDYTFTPADVDEIIKKGSKENLSNGNILYSFSKPIDGWRGRFVLLNKKGHVIDVGA